MNETSKKLNTFVAAFIIVNLVTCFLFVLPTFGDENQGWVGGKKQKRYQGRNQMGARK